MLVKIYINDSGISWIIGAFEQRIGYNIIVLVNVCRLRGAVGDEESQKCAKR